jgi:prepilin-type N-terminal cleavage/methylation domain-containing protein
MRRAFTLVEILVVITIIGLVSILALPTVIASLSHRQVSEAARILQAAWAGARDAAIRDNSPSGIRLLVDPNFSGLDSTTGLIDPSLPLAANRIIPLAKPPAYSEGLVSCFPGAAYLATVTAGTEALVLEQSPGTWTQGVAGWVYLPNSPTSWFWNIRVGDRVQLNQTGRWYTVVGPLGVAANNGNSELFANVGLPGTDSPLSRTLTAPDGVTTTKITPEFLLLVNGQDDNGNGWVDEGFDGVDNDGDDVPGDNFALVDETTCKLNPAHGEWEPEAWVGAAAGGLNNVAYSIDRRPAPAINAREVALPSNVVIDLTDVFTTRDRSRLPVDRRTGYVDLVVNPDGTVVPTTIYSSPSSVGLDGAFAHFWLAERSDVWTPMQAPKGEWRLVTIFCRTGAIVTTDEPDLANPYAYAQQGGR